MKSNAQLAVRKEVWWMLAALAVTAGCLWPWKALQKLPAQQRAAEQQLMLVQGLAAQAQQLRTQARPITGDSAVQLQQAVQRLLADAAQLSTSGDTAVLSLQSVPAHQWVAALEAMQQAVPVRIVNAKLDLQQGQVSGRVELQWPAQ